MWSLIGRGGGGGDVDGGDAGVGVEEVGGGDLDIRKRLSNDVRGFNVI